MTAEACAPAVNDALRGFIDECASSCTPGANATKGLGGGCAAALKTVLQDPACHELLCTAAPLLAHLPRADHATPYCPYRAPPQNGTNMTAAQAAAREEEPEDNGRNDDKAVEATKVADGADAVPYIKDGVAGDGNGGVGEWRGEDPDGQGTADPTAETSKDKFGCASQIGVSTAPTTSGCRTTPWARPRATPTAPRSMTRTAQSRTQRMPSPRPPPTSLRSTLAMARWRCSSYRR